MGRGNEKDDIRLYLEQAGEYELLTRDEEMRLARAWRENHDETAREKLGLHNLRLVVSIAVKYTCSFMSLMDFIQEGNIGLMKAIDKFDPDRGNRLSTVATWWIWQSIGRAVSEKGGNVIRLPVNTRNILHKFSKTKSELAHSLMRDPEDEDVIEAMDLSEPQEACLRNALASRVVSVEDEESSCGIENLFGELEENISEFDDYRVRDAISIALNSKERMIISLRYGLDDGKQRTLDTVGQELELTRERVRQIESQALDKLSLFLSGSLIYLNPRHSGKSGLQQDCKSGVDC